MWSENTSTLFAGWVKEIHRKVGIKQLDRQREDLGKICYAKKDKQKDLYQGAVSNLPCQLSHLDRLLSETEWQASLLYGILCFSVLFLQVYIS